MRTLSSTWEKLKLEQHFDSPGKLFIRQACCTGVRSGPVLAEPFRLFTQDCWSFQRDDFIRMSFDAGGRHMGRLGIVTLYCCVHLQSCCIDMPLVYVARC